MTALVTGSPDKVQELADFYDIPKVYTYDQYDELLASGEIDAVYIALPNSMHADYAIRALNAGIHALVEKPLALDEAECQAMIAASEASGAYLMTAYRLHNEPGTIDVFKQIREGVIGTPRIFQSVFSFQSGPVSHRLVAKYWGGPLQDIGVYCLNAARHVFGEEPTEAMAMKHHGDDPRFQEVEEMIAGTLRFPSGGIAQFNASFGANLRDTFTVIGTDGELIVEKAYEFQTATVATLRKDGTSETRGISLDGPFLRPV